MLTGGGKRDNSTENVAYLYQGICSACVQVVLPPGRPYRSRRLVNGLLNIDLKVRIVPEEAKSASDWRQPSGA